MIKEIFYNIFFIIITVYGIFDFVYALKLHKELTIKKYTEGYSNWISTMLYQTRMNIGFDVILFSLGAGLLTFNLLCGLRL